MVSTGRDYSCHGACHRSTSLAHFCKPMARIQNLVRRREGFHRRRSCTFGPSRHKLPRSVCSCEPPQPLEELHGSYELGVVVSGGAQISKLVCAFFVLTLALGLSSFGS